MNYQTKSSFRRVICEVVILLTRGKHLLGRIISIKGKA